MRPFSLRRAPLVALSLVLWPWQASSQVPHQRPLDRHGNTTYTLAQILERQNSNWEKLRDVQFMVVRIQSGLGSATNEVPGSTNQSRVIPRALPGRVPQVASSGTARSGETQPQATQTPAVGPFVPKQSLPSTREVLISGIADHARQRAVTLVLPGQAAQIYRRRSGDVVWGGEVQATFVDGALQRAHGFQADPQPRTNSRGIRLPVGRDLPIEPRKDPTLAPPPYTGVMNFHPRQLTDLPFLVRAWERNEAPQLIWIGPDQLQVTALSAEGKWTAILRESASFLPQQVILSRNEQIVERHELLLRQVGGVWLAGRATLSRSNGGDEHWYYERYAANQGLPTRGVTPEFLRLPEGTEWPEWLKAQSPSSVPAMPTPPIP